MEENKKKVVTPVFADIEGTILKEANNDDIDAKFDRENFSKVLAQFDEYEKITNSKIRLYIVSPMFRSIMQRLLRKMDITIINYNRDHHSNLDFVCCATAEDDPTRTAEDFFRNKSQDSRIVPYVENRDELLAKGTVGTGKESFVNSVLRSLKTKSNFEIKNVIYCGNGRNDILSVQRINELDNGYAICPKNTRGLLKEKVEYVSPYTDCEGFADGMRYINEQERLKKSKAEKKKSLDDNDDLDR